MRMHLQTLLLMNIATAVQLHAQPTITEQPNWIAAIRQCLGPQTNVAWFQDLDSDQLHLFVTADRALVILDLEPIINQGESAMLRPSILSLGGTRLDLIGDVVAVNDSIQVGTYRGTLGGQAVIMEQYMHTRQGLLLARGHVIRRSEASEPMRPRIHDELLCTLLADRTAAGTPGHGTANDSAPALSGVPSGR